MGVGVTSRHSCVALAGENSREPSPTRPESSCTIIHLAMSAAPDMIPPAGLVLSLANGSTARTVSFTSAWVPATFPPAVAPETDVAVAHTDLGQDAGPDKVLP